MPQVNELSWFYIIVKLFPCFMMIFLSLYFFFYFCSNKIFGYISCYSYMRLIK